MDTFDTLQALLSHDLHELHQMQKRGWRTLPMTRLVKEEHLGRCCYLAEEFLSTAELCALKKEKSSRPDCAALQRVFHLQRGSYLLWVRKAVLSMMGIDLNV